MASVMLGLQEIYDLVSKINNIATKAKNIEEIVKTKFIAEGSEEIKFAFDLIIEQWYGDYKRKSYKPTKSLLNAYKIKTTDNSILVDTSEDYISDTHRLSPSGIYSLSFMEGYHGGAKSGTIGIHGHPYPGKPMYVNFANGRAVGWMRPPNGVAKKSFSPLEYLEIRAKQLQNKDLPDLANKIFVREVQSLFDELNTIIIN